MFYQSTSDVFENAFTPVGEKSEVCRAEKSDRVLVVRRALLRGELVRRKKTPAVAIHPDERAMRYFLKS